MKVTLISHYYPPHVGGLEMVAKRQADELASLGHTVTVVTTKGDAAAGETKEGKVTVYRGAAFDYFDKKFGIPFPFPGLKLCAALFNKARKADVVHLHDVWYPTSWIGFLGAVVGGTPVLTTQHVALVVHPSKLVMAAEHAVYLFAGEIIWRTSKYIVVYNDIVRDFLLKRGIKPGKILQMRNGIDIEQFRPVRPEEKAALRQSFNLPLDKKLVLFAGRFVPKKGFDDLLGAGSDAYDLVFAGSGHFPESAAARKDVHNVGSQSQSRLADLYRACDIFALPARGELFTLVMQEAMASALPLLTTDEPEYAASDLDRNLVALVTPHAEPIKQALMRIAKDDALSARMSAYSRSYAIAHFDWKANFTPLAALYDSLAPHSTTTSRSDVLVTTSWDDGHALDLKLAALMQRYGIKGTFYISPEDKEFIESERLGDEGIRALAKDGFEIGAHTMSHTHLTKLDDFSARKEIVRSKTYLEAVIGKPVTSFCYPAGFYAAPHVAMAHDAGFTLARTVKRFAFMSRDPLQLETTIHTYRHWSDILHILRAVGWKKFLRCLWNWDDLAIELFDECQRVGGVYHLWGHSWEVERHGDWARLERVFAHIGKRPHVRYVTNAELV